MTLKQMAERVLAGRALEIELGDFLDAFYRRPTDEAVREEPPLLPEGRRHGTVTNSFLAATAEHLCRRYDLPIPSWAFDRRRYLDWPFFAMEAPSFRATLLLESPMEFRSRNLFVTANALSRASETASLPQVV
jgi:hypothetical protein